MELRHEVKDTIITVVVLVYLASMLFILIGMLGWAILHKVQPTDQDLVLGTTYTTKWCEPRQDGKYYAVLAVADKKDASPRLYLLDSEPPVPGFVWDEESRPIPIGDIPVEVESAPASVPTQ